MDGSRGNHAVGQVRHLLTIDLPHRFSDGVIDRYLRENVIGIGKQSQEPFQRVSRNAPLFDEVDNFNHCHARNADAGARLSSGAMKARAAADNRLSPKRDQITA